ncbi:unnamed protein product [Rotaria sp. Silwood2]|nr:unnamed protein product [Rotaria sp. Silwood2]CAF3093564.1 unnamed protein product [Rotaria sp. Silwood2]CAF4287242.1 unnamed protein product [Rotaria sp. Silwood2]
MMDFERCSINVFGDKFTTTNPSAVSGCFSHLQKEFGLKTSFEQGSAFAYHVNQIADLVFLYPNNVNENFCDVFNSLPHKSHLLLYYFGDTYVERRLTQTRLKSMIEVEF